MSTDPVPTFVSASPLIEARRIADMELRGTATGHQVAWLHRNLPLWLRALRHIKFDIEAEVAKDRLDLEPLKPPAGGLPGDKYLAAKAQVAARTRARLDFTRAVDRRADEVKAKLGPQPAVGWMSAADMVDILVSIAASATAGDLDDAAAQANYWADRWARQLLDDEAAADTAMDEDEEEEAG